MSKVLKFIVHLVVICTLICVLGLVLPPFFGVKTVIVDKADKSTNLPVGSVTYAVPEKSSDVSEGTAILVQEDSKTYCYTISGLNQEKGTGTVVDPTVSGGDSITVKIGEYMPRVVVTIPYIGYLLVATESIEGLIILGLVVLFLVILYVIAELWKKDPETVHDGDDEEEVYVKSRKELKREEKERARRMKEEEKEIIREERSRRRRKKSDKRVVRTGGFVDEIEEEVREETTAPEKPSVKMQTAASEAHEELKKEIAAATADEQEPTVVPKRSVAAPSAGKPKADREVVKAEENIEPEEIGSLAMPVWSAAQLASRAKKAGDAPDIVKDDITNVTLFDYSDIISGEDENIKE